MKKEDIESIAALLAIPKKIAIIPHRSPDGDAMGSTLALYHFLLKGNHQPVVIAPNEFPEFLAWLPSSEKVLIFENDKEKSTQLLQECDLIFTLDFNALHRVGEMEKILIQLKAPFVMIDHHQSPDNYAAFTYSDTKFGSTCEMVYNFISFLNQKEHLDKTIAPCIYTGILTDSGSFRFPKTTGTTHRIIAELIDLGVENTKIPMLLFDNNSYNTLPSGFIPDITMSISAWTQAAKYVLSGDDQGGTLYITNGVTVPMGSYALLSTLPTTNMRNMTETLQILYKSYA